MRKRAHVWGLTGYCLIGLKGLILTVSYCVIETGRKGLVTMSHGVQLSLIYESMDLTRVSPAGAGSAKYNFKVCAWPIHVSLSAHPRDSADKVGKALEEVAGTNGRGGEEG